MGQEMMTISHQRVGWGIWLKWVLATVLGWFAASSVGILATMLFIPQPGPVGFADTKAAFLLPDLTGGGIAGLTLGTVQWFVLRRRIHRAHRWIFASAVGWAVTWSVINPVEMGANRLDGVLFGASLGVLQSIVLSQWKWVSLVWLFASTAGWGMGLGILCNCGAMTLILETVGYEAWFSIPGVIAGSITGLAMVWLLSRLPRQFDQASATRF